MGPGGDGTGFGGVSKWIDPDDAPELTDEWFDKADL